MEQPQTERHESTRPDEYRIQRSESRKTNTYNSFLNKLTASTSLPRELAEAAAVSVLCTLERRITAEEAGDLKSQLPAKLRDCLDRCALHEGEKPGRFGREAFYEMVAEDLGKPKDEVASLVGEVMAAIKAWISPGEAEDVAAQLPGDIKEIWTSA